MLIRSRALRVTLLVLAILAAAGYIAFATFLYSPFESDYEADLSTLVPRDVDFYAAKSGLARDFDPFPEPAIASRVAETSGWRAFAASPEFGEWDEAQGWTRSLEALRGALAQVPGGIDPLAAFGGKDLAIAGYFRGHALADADFALYGRTSAVGKLAAALLSHPGVLGLDSQGMSAAVNGPIVTLSGGNLAREIHVTRIRDVVVAGSSRELVQKARDLEARSGQDSLGQSAAYNDYISHARRTVLGHDLELAVDWRKLASSLALSGAWPDPNAQEFTTRLASRLFQLGALNSIAGVVGFDGGVGLDLHGELASDMMTPAQKSLYRVRGVETERVVRELAQIARSDTQVLACLQVDLRDFLKQVVESMQDAQRTLLEDSLRSTGQFAGLDAAIDELEALFKGRIGLIVRRNDYRPRKPEEDPPHNDVPVPLYTLCLWTEGTDKAHKRIRDLQQMISDNQTRLGLRGPAGAKAVYTNKLAGGYECWEFWQPEIDGTGHVAVARDGDRYYISNSYSMLQEVLLPASLAGPVERLADKPEFNALVGEGLPASNLFLWVNPRALAPTLRALADYTAADEIRARIDWSIERPRIEEPVIRDLFPGKARGTLTAEEQQQVDAIVGPRAIELENRLIAEHAPKLREAVERRVVYSEMVSGALLMLALDPKQLHLTLGATIPLEPAR
jgi:hypothetical protein